MSLKDGALWPRSNPTLMREWEFCLKTVGCPNSRDLSAFISTICVPDKATPETLSPQSQDTEWVVWGSMVLRSNSRLRNQQIPAGALDEHPNPPTPSCLSEAWSHCISLASSLGVPYQNEKSVASLPGQGFCIFQGSTFQAGGCFFLGVGLLCAPQHRQGLTT